MKIVANFQFLELEKSKIVDNFFIGFEKYRETTKGEFAMIFPAYTDDVYWKNVIKQYIQNNNKHPEWYKIEYYMWEYFKNCLKRNNRFFFEHPLLPVLESEFKRNEYILS